MHARRAIVLAAAQALTGLVTTGARVYPGRADPKRPAAPGAYLLVYARQEQSEPLTTGGASRKLRRMVVLRVEAVSINAADDDAELDQIALEIEQAMSADLTLGGTAKDIYPTTTDLAVSLDGEQRVARLRIDFNVSYQTLQNAADTAV